jgi:glyceraldehyde-3-phosphate dehydrogenase/erythrose-4-phosphate dehydrogenase
VCTPRPNANVLALLRRAEGIPLVAYDEGSEEAFRMAGIRTSGRLSELLSSGEVDVVVDASPGGAGAEKKWIWVNFRASINTCRALSA